MCEVCNAAAATVPLLPFIWRWLKERRHRLFRHDPEQVFKDNWSAPDWQLFKLPPGAVGRVVKHRPEGYVEVLVQVHAGRLRKQ